MGIDRTKVDAFIVAADLWLSMLESTRESEAFDDDDESANVAPTNPLRSPDPQVPGATENIGWGTE